MDPEPVEAPLVPLWVVVVVVVEVEVVELSVVAVVLEVVGSLPPPVEVVGSVPLAESEVLEPSGVEPVGTLSPTSWAAKESAPWSGPGRLLVAAAAATPPADTTPTALITANMSERAL